jgi:hypothetical protein
MRTPVLILLVGLGVAAEPRGAIVTLVTSNDGYVSGAAALGASLVATGSQLPRVAMVTSEVSEPMREVLRTLWEVVEVEPIPCNHKMNASITADRFDLSSESYKAGIAKWRHTCTKFAAFTLSSYERLIFMDADTIAVGPVDDALYGFSRATLAAAPETFPPDTFNSGFLVLTPGSDVLRRLLDANERVGSAEGGDQGVLNNGFCRDWYTASPDDPHCGRLPWIFNVNAVNYAPYKALREMQNQRAPAVIHFVSSNKPWKHLAAELSGVALPEVLRAELEKQGAAQQLWRNAYYAAKEMEMRKAAAAAAGGARLGGSSYAAVDAEGVARPASAALAP